jgi:hypothetical protein
VRGRGARERHWLEFRNSFSSCIICKETRNEGPRNWLAIAIARLPSRLLPRHRLLLNGSCPRLISRSLLNAQVLGAHPLKHFYQLPGHRSSRCLPYLLTPIIVVVPDRSLASHVRPWHITCHIHCEALLAVLVLTLTFQNI